MCYLSTLVQTFFSEKIRIIYWKTLSFSSSASPENLVENFRFSMLTFEYSLEKIRINLSSSKNFIKNIEVKVSQKSGRFPCTLRELLKKWTNFQTIFQRISAVFEKMQSFSDQCLEISIHFKKNSWKIRYSPISAGYFNSGKSLTLWKVRNVR